MPVKINQTRRIFILLLLLGFLLPVMGMAAARPVKKAWTISVTISGTTTLCTGTAINLTAQAFNYGPPSMTFQWKKNGSNITKAYSGSAPPPFVSFLTYNTVSNGDVFTCVVTSTTTGTATSNALTASVGGPQNFVVVPVPSANSLCLGAAVTFTANSAQPMNTW